MNPQNVRFVCGAECGINAVGTASILTKHFSSIIGAAPTVVTAPPFTMRPGSLRCFRFNTTNQQSQLSHTYSSAIISPATVVIRHYVYFTTLPNGDMTFFQGVGGNVKFQLSDSKLYATEEAVGSQGATGVAVTTGVLYRIDFKVVNGATRTADLQVNGVAAGQASAASANQGSTTIAFGNGGSVSVDMYIDDLIVSGTSADYPIGDGAVIGLYPNGDRTNSAANPTDGNKGHLFSATTDFGKGASGATATGAQNVEATSWQSLDKPLSTTAAGSWIANLLGASTEWMVWTLDDLPANAAAINGVILVATTHSATATTNDFGLLKPYSPAGGSTGGIAAGSDLSELTIIVISVPLTVSPDNTAWTIAQLNATNIIWGGSADVNPDPYLDGVCLEVDVVLYQPRVVMVNQAVQRAAVR